MELWEREIESIQRNIYLSLRCVILIEPHPGLREMLSYAISFLGKHYYPLPMTFEQAKQWLQERERQQMLASIFLFDCSHERVQVEQFLAQVRASRITLSRSPKVLGMTHEPSSLLCDHTDIDSILLKPFKLRELRTYLL